MSGDIVVLGLIALLVVAGVFLLCGKGAFLIAGYNTSSKEEKAKYDEKALCRFMGKVILGIAALIAAMHISEQFSLAWLGTVSVVCSLTLIVFALVYVNTGNRFKK